MKTTEMKQDVETQEKLQFQLLYMDLMRYQVLAHTAAQTNDLQLLISAWKAFIPMYFAMNKVNYARQIYITSFFESISYNTLTEQDCACSACENVKKDHFTFKNKKEICICSRINAKKDGYTQCLLECYTLTGVEGCFLHL